MHTVLLMGQNKIMRKISGTNVLFQAMHTRLGYSTMRDENNKNVQVTSLGLDHETISWWGNGGGIPPTPSQATHKGFLTYFPTFF